jgi:hypothetical protein
VPERSLGRQGRGDGAAAGAEIGDAQRRARRQLLERDLDQQLGLRTRDQGGGRHAQLQAPERLSTADIGDGLAAQATAEECVEALARLGCDRLLGPGDQRVRGQPVASLSSSSASKRGAPSGMHHQRRGCIAQDSADGRPVRVSVGVLEPRGSGEDGVRGR